MDIREDFERLAAFLFGSYDLRHRVILIHEDDTLFEEGVLLHEGCVVDKGGYWFVPVIDVLWARAQLEGFPNGGGQVLADLEKKGT